LTQLESLQPNVKEKAERAPSCFTQYSPLGKAFKDIIRKRCYIIDTDPQLKPIFKYPPHIVFKRPPNVRDIVVKSDYPPENRETFLDKVPEGNYKCGQCAHCSFTYKCDSFTHPRTGQKFKIKGLITCMSTNDVYMVKYPCGKTPKSLKTRISEHHSNIRTGETKNPVAVHFVQAGHPITSVRYIGMEMVKMSSRGGDIERKCLERGSFWIHRLNTLSPLGVNEEFFIERGYKDNWVKHASDRVEGLTQLESLQPNVKEKAERAPSCFTQYSPLGKAFKDIIWKRCYIIDTDPQLKPIFKYPPHIVFKRPP
ncbi:unnamed protein product, partial [Coregonus sp. 'balchen']